MQSKIIGDISIYNLRKKEDKLIIKQILEKILNKKVAKLNLTGTEKFEHIPEYNFKLLKIEIVLENNIKHDVYLKIINKKMIQETIFCYWYFCEEKYGININKKEKYYVKRATITEYQSQYYRKKFNIKFLNKKYKVHKSSNLYFIDLEKYFCKLNLQEKGIFLDNGTHNDGVLFIGII